MFSVPTTYVLAEKKRKSNLNYTHLSRDPNNKTALDGIIHGSRGGGRGPDPPGK